MIDTVRLNVRAGNGGNGCASFLTEKYQPRGGPNGGDGGNGGNAFICGDPSLNTLLHLKLNSTIIGAKGTHGKGKNMRGRDGQATVIPVPVGTQASRMSEDGTKEFLVDVIDTEPHLIAQGGRGGWGNTRYVSATNREPVLAQMGERGKSTVLFLELKLLADVGLLARPNAGKSTLISRCSAAKPRIADYPFTTVEPVLGVVSHRDKDFVMMEVPGLLEGAHRGVGLGHQFLRHAERARIYIHIIDGLSEDPAADLRMLRNELRQFNPALADKQEIIAVNKVDVTEVRERRQEIDRDLSRAARETAENEESKEDVPLFYISAVTGAGLQELLDRVIGALAELPAADAEAAQAAGPIPLRPSRATPELVYKENGVFVVESEHLERLVALADTRDQRVILQLWREMTQRRVAKRLTDAGIEPGDTIRIGQVEVEWF